MSEFELDVAALLSQFGHFDESLANCLEKGLILAATQPELDSLIENCTNIIQDSCCSYQLLAQLIDDYCCHRIDYGNCCQQITPLDAATSLLKALTKSLDTRRLQAITVPEINTIILSCSTVLEQVEQELTRRCCYG